MKTFLFVLFFIPAIALGQTQKDALFFCIDHSGKTVHYSTGKAVVKNNLEGKEFYQYGFLKWKGWINKSWETLDYDFKFLPGNAKKQSRTYLDSLFQEYRGKGYAMEKVPMPYPMRPFAGYKKDGTNR